jgi:hypothetical protein
MGLLGSLAPIGQTTSEMMDHDGRSFSILVYRTEEGGRGKYKSEKKKLTGIIRS